MQLYGGPLDGYDASPSELSASKALFGLVRRKTGYGFKPNEESTYYDAEPPTHKQALHAEYVYRGERWVFAGLRA